MVQINDAGLAELSRRHDVRALKLFGSSAKGEDRPDSDIDLLVEFEGDKSLFDLIGLELELEEFSPEAARQLRALRSHIRGEVRPT